MQAIPNDLHHPTRTPSSLRDWLGLNAATVSLLVTILLITAATELWEPVVPVFLKSLQPGTQAVDARFILLIGAYGFLRDANEAVNYFIGGGLAARLNTRRALLLFNFLPLAGMAILGLSKSWVGVFIAVPLILSWSSLAGPATITVVGDALPPDRRTMAFFLQSIFKRLARILAYAVSGLLVWGLGPERGVRFDVIIAMVLVVAAAAVQYRFMSTASRDKVPALHRPRRLLRQLNPDLRRLLAADIASRWAEGLAGPFVILFCVPLLSANPATGTALYQSMLLNIQAATCMVLYIIIGPLASREGLAKKPYIGLTFVFFGLFPAAVLLLGWAGGMAGLSLAFVIGGLREIGEPARKAMIADLVPEGVRTQAIGLYWSVRGLAVMGASPVGAMLWITGDTLKPGYGPGLTFLVAALVGLTGSAWFFSRFGRSRAVTAPV